MIDYYLLSVLLLLVGYFAYQNKKKYDSFWKHIYAIPGPDTLPIIGNLTSLPTDPGKMY